MHEHALMSDLMRQILKTAKSEEAQAVVAVSVWLGALSHMSPDHFAEHFEQAAAGTIAEGAAIAASRRSAQLGRRPTTRSKPPSTMCPAAPR